MANKLSAALAKALEALTHDEHTAITVYGIGHLRITNGRGSGQNISQAAETALYRAGYIVQGPGTYPIR
jgi:hypothetical protein